MSRSMFSHACVLGSMFSTCFMPSFMCSCVPCHVCVLEPRPCLSCHVLLQPFCSFYHIFLCFGLMVRTRSKPYGLCHRPYTEAHIKGFGSSPFCMSMLASFSALCLCQPHQFQALPCLTPLVGCGCVVTSEAHEALFGCNHLRCITVMPVASCTPFPFFAPCDDMLTMLVCATCWLHIHLHTLAYMSMHESCLLVCRPRFNTMKLWTFDPNQLLGHMCFTCQDHMSIFYVIG